MGTLAILGSSAKQIALSWEKPKPSTCGGLVRKPHDGTCCQVLYKPWKTSPSLSRIHMVIDFEGSLREGGSLQ